MATNKLGKLLMDADIITKRQLSQATQKQQNGDDRKLGQILIEMGYVTVEDLTEVMMNKATEAQSETEKSKRDVLLQKQIFQTKAKPKPVVEKKAPKTSNGLSDDQILKTKFNLSVQSIVAGVTGIASLLGMWYALQADIQANVFRIDTLEKEVERLRGDK